MPAMLHSIPHNFIRGCRSVFSPLVTANRIVFRNEFENFADCGLCHERLSVVDGFIVSVFTGLSTTIS